MKWDGVMLNKRGKKRDHLAEAKRMAQMAGLCVLPDIKMPRAVRKDKGVRRGVSQQPERELRIAVLKYLKRVQSRVWRIENAIIGRKGRGFPDLLFFYQSKFYFCELKSETGTLRIEQKEFKLLCEESNTLHLVVRSVDDLKQAGVI